MTKDIINTNGKGQYHGYQECYWNNGELLRKCFYNNGDIIDYYEFYNHNGKLYKSFWV